LSLSIGVGYPESN